ncbi:LysR family transcriptional regulator [Pasteurellaceae bacterium RH1A]|nr:LysR family transcriptional regulator [Pasteurellaceae bacterium RH1A]
MPNFNDLHTFIQIAQAGSFTLAAERLGVSKSALSHSIRNLETELAIRLFNRNTRRISLTDAGLQLFQHIQPLFTGIVQEVNALGDFHDNPKGLVRINCSDFVAQTLLYPKLRPFLLANRQIRVDIFCDNSLSDIIGQGFDFGVRMGESLNDEMIAVKISEPFEMITVASPDYLSQFGKPETLAELNSHITLAMRFTADQGNPVAWEFQQGDKVASYRPTPQFSHNLNNDLYQAALDGIGIAWLPRLTAQTALADGSLVELFPDWAMTYEPFYLYYPSRKGNSAVFRLVVDALKV